MMQYEKFVVAVKAGEKFLRDQDGVVKLPFNTDYSLFLKNINSRDAVVGISIDGEDVLNNQKLVINANTKMELLGFLEGQSVKHKFRFIELTKDIEQKIGYSPLDSIIRIEVTYRKPKPVVQEITTVYRPHWEYYHYSYPVYNYSDSNRMPVDRSINVSCSSYSDGLVGTASVSCDSFTSDVGITVKGQECNQDFGITHINDLEEQSHVLVVRLSGYREDNSKVETVITSREKVECDICGKKNDNQSKFCANCGSFLK
jgi:hypothetical protein